MSLVIYYIISIISFLGWSSNVIVKCPAPFPLHVLIPAHNEGETIRGILSDLTNQTLPKEQFEVIVVNDRSTDNTVAVVKEFEKQLRIKLLHIYNVPTGLHGKLYAMHIATQNIRHGSVVFVDADCRASPEWLETLVHEAGKGGAVGPVFEIWHAPNWWKEILSLDQASVTYAVMGLIARSKPITASTANMLIPSECIQNEFWAKVGTDGTGEDGRILQNQYASNKPMRAVIQKQSAVFTSLAKTFLQTAAARRRWFRDATTYPLKIQIIQSILAFSLLGLLSNVVALFFFPEPYFPIWIYIAKYIMDFINLKKLRKLFPIFTFRSFLIWSPLQPWLLLFYAIAPRPNISEKRGFAVF
ncbi:MAG: glycosyltransferase [bacterium]|nr:glycosyltransferase [bacterium]